MRSRFEAFRVGDAEWLLATWHHTTRPAALDLEDNPRWQWLEVIDAVAGGPGDETGIVEFEATHLLPNGAAGVLHERSRFVREEGRWYYVAPIDHGPIGDRA